LFKLKNKNNKVDVVVYFIGEMTYLKSNDTTTMVISRTITLSRGAEGKYFIFFGNILQEVIINTLTIVALTMVALISAATPEEEEDEEEVYFALTQKDKQ
jgi:hypothetical protein